MGQILHGSATTTEAVRRAIQCSQAPRDAGTALWRSSEDGRQMAKRAAVPDCRRGPKTPHPTVLTREEEAIVIAFRRHIFLPLDDRLYALRATIPHLSGSSLQRDLQRHRFRRLPDIEGYKHPKRKFRSCSTGFFHIDIADVQAAEAKLHLFVAIARASTFAFVQPVDKANRVTASDFLPALIKAVPYKIHTIPADKDIHFRVPPGRARGLTAKYSTPMFARRCNKDGVGHRCTKINHPWTQGQVERMNQTIKKATVKRYPDDDHDQLRRHSCDFVNACHTGRWLKALKGLTP